MKKTILAFLTIFSMPALAQQEINIRVPCASTDSVIRVLVREFKEQPILIGTTSEKLIVTIWKGLTTDSFTVTITNENDMTCALVEGKELRPAAKQTRGN